MNYKRKSRRRFFLLMRSRTPPISSEFRGAGFEPRKPPPSVRHWHPCHFDGLQKFWRNWEEKKFSVLTESRTQDFNRYLNWYSWMGAERRYKTRKKERRKERNHINNKQHQYYVSSLSERMFAVERYLQPFGESALSKAGVLKGCASAH